MRPTSSEDFALPHSQEQLPREIPAPKLFPCQHRPPLVGSRERAARDRRKNMNFGIRMNWNLSFESASSVTLSKSFCLRYCPLLPSPHFWTKTLIFPRMGVAKVVG